MKDARNSSKRYPAWASRMSAGRMRVLVIFILSLALWLIYISQLFADEKTTMKVRSGSEIDYPPFCIVHEDGRVDGFSVELMRAALGKMGRELTFRTGTWAEVRGWLERGEVQALPLVGRTPEREPLFDFTVPYMTMHGAIVVRKETEDVGGLSDLRGRRVCVMKGDNAEEFLRREDRGVEIVTTPTFSDAFRVLAEGRCEAVVIQRLVAVRLLEETGLTNLKIVDRPIREFSQDFCFAVKEGNREMLSILNEGLALAVADGTHRRLHAKWFAQLELPADRPIVVGGDHNYPPFEFLDDNGRPAGFTVELTRAIARELNMEVRIELGPWEDRVNALRDGRIDALEGMFYSPERDRVLDFSPRYLVIHCVSVVRKGEGPPPTTIEELQGCDLVVQAEDAILDALAERGIEARITTVKTQEDVVRAVAEGRNACGVGTRFGALYAIRKNGWPNIEVGDREFYSGDYAYAVPHGNEPLLAKCTEGLRILKDSGEYQRIYEKWLGIYEPGVSSRMFLKRIAIVAGPLLLLAILALVWSWSLRRQVTARTRELRESEEMLRAVMDNLPIGIAVNSVDPAVEFSYMNDHFPRCYRTTREALAVSDGFWKAAYEDAEFREEIRKRVLDDCASGDLERMHWEDVPITREGEETTFVSAYNTPIPGRNLTISTVLDITERKLIEESLRKSEEKFSILFRENPLPMALSRYPDHGFADVNDAWLRLFGFTREETAGKTSIELGINRDVEAREHTIEELHAHGAVRSIERTLHTKSGNALIILTNISTVTIDGQRFALHAMQDITELRQAEAERNRLSGERQLALDAATLGWWCYDPATKIAIYDERYKEIFGVSSSQRPYEEILELLHPDDLPHVWAAVEAALDPDNPRPYAAEYRINRRGNGLRWIEAHGLTVFEGQGAERRAVSLVGTVEDITERKTTENRIQHLNLVLRAIRDVNQLITHETDRDTLLRRSCEILVSTRGYRSAWVALRDTEGNLEAVAESGIGEDFGAVRERLERGEWPECFRRALEHPDGITPIHDTSINCKTCALSKDYRDTASLAGRLRHAGRDYGVLVVALPEGLADDAEEQSLFRELIGDVAYALRAMETRQSHARYEQTLQAVFRSASDGILMADAASGRFVLGNDSICRMLGYSHEEIDALSLADIHRAEDLEHVRAKFEQQARGEITLAEDIPVKRKDGTVFPADVNSAVFDLEGRRHVAGIFRDISERKRAEKVLKEAYDIINRSSSVAFTWKNAAGWPVEFVSENVQKLLGYKAEEFILGQVSYTDRIHVQDLPRVVEEVARMSVKEKAVEFVHEPYRVIAKDGSEKFVRDWTFIVRDNEERITHYKGIVEDITKQRSLEAQLTQAQKMEAVGRLAGGVAHDYNNILTVIIGYSELAMEKVGAEDSLRDDLKEIYAAANRSRDITRQLLAFARKETIAPQVLDLNATVESMLKILRKLIGEDIDLSWHPGKVFGPVLMDPSQLDQILANLCVNARDAISDVGRISIETDMVNFDEAYCADHAGFVPGEFVLLAVSDDGCGMDRETMDNIFEPFFTTKGLGKGTGLGLSTVYGIVKQNNGFINVYSEPSHGTAFRIYLPRHSGEISGEQRIIDEQVPNGNGETILVVEDEMSILKLAERILFRCNYKVLLAKSPSEAMKVVQAHSGKISLLITDVVMPEMNGLELADHMKNHCPGIKCLFMSGYTANIIAHRGVLDEGIQFIQKPFSTKGLAAKVREVLDEKRLI